MSNAIDELIEYLAGVNSNSNDEIIVRDDLSEWTTQSRQFSTPDGWFNLGTLDDLSFGFNDEDRIKGAIEDYGKFGIVWINDKKVKFFTQGIIDKWDDLNQNFIEAILDDLSEVFHQRALEEAKDYVELFLEKKENAKDKYEYEYQDEYGVIV